MCVELHALYLNIEQCAEKEEKLPPAQEALEEFNAHVSNLLSQESVQKPKKVFVSITKDCETGHLVLKPRKKYDHKSRPRKGDLIIYL